MQDATDGAGILVRVRRSKTDQEGTAADVRDLKSGLRRRAPPVAFSAHRAAVRGAPGADIEGRITGHSGRVGLASELTARGASTTETMLAGGWKTVRMVAHYSAAVTAEQGAVAKYL